MKKGAHGQTALSREEKLAQNVMGKAKLSGADVALYLAEAVLGRLKNLGISSLVPYTFVRRCESGRW